MSQASLEDRVATLEEQVRELMAKLESSERIKDWRSTIGMFAGDEVMKEIDEEIRRARQADREQAYRDHS